MNQLFIDDNAVLFTYHFYVAGTETSAHSMSWLLLMMCLHQDVQKKVIDEIDQQIGKYQHRANIFSLLVYSIVKNRYAKFYLLLFMNVTLEAFNCCLNFQKLFIYNILILGFSI